jgi:periplasmic protein TonB
MADTDYLHQRAFNPASLGATVAINGGILAMLLTLAGGVAAVIPDNDGIRIFTPAALPIPVPQPETRKKEKKEPVDILRPTQEYTTPTTANKPPQGSNTLTAATGIVPPPPPGPAVGAGTEAIIPVPIVIPPHVPTFTTSQIDARYRSAFQPAYPDSMLRAGREGIAIVRVLIGTDGRVKQVEAVSGDDEAFLQATRAHALKKWRFKPATEDGIPVETWRELTVRFEIPA